MATDTEPYFDLRFAQIRRSGLIDPARPATEASSEVLLEANNLQFERGKIYTVEGPNQSGKSTLISALVGAFGTSRFQVKGGSPLEVNLNLSVNGVRRSFSSPQEANAAGLVAVFQDDDMLGTLTVREQIRLRHALRGFPAALGWLANKADPTADIPPVSKWLHDIGRWVFPLPAGVMTAQAVDRKLDQLLAKFSLGSEVNYSEILDKRPLELSGGARAIARLLSALVSRDIRVLFLDEAFRGIQSDVWPHIVDVLRAMAEDDNFAVVVVSHNKVEIVRWQPKVRYGISDGKLASLRPQGYLQIIPSIERSAPYFPIYEQQNIDLSDWQQMAMGNSVVIYDSAVEHNEGFIELRKRIEGLSRALVVPISGGEKNKGLTNYVTLLQDILEKSPKPIDSFFIIGGGVVLNLAGLVAATINRGEARIIIVPTTVMAMADVAVGSKTGVNINTGYERSNLGTRKNAVGVYANPDAVILNREFLRELPESEVRNGLVECLKHGVCQDVDILDECIAALIEPSDRDSIFSIALRVLNLKAQILTIDPFEENVGRILQFGHLHAHALERALNFTISHGSAVLWGILIDLHLSSTLRDGISLFDTVVKKIRVVELLSGHPAMTVTSSQLIQFYAGDAKRFHHSERDSKFRVLNLPEAGYFGNVNQFRYPKAMDSYIRTYDLPEIMKGVVEVQAKLKT